MESNSPDSFKAVVLLKRMINSCFIQGANSCTLQTCQKRQQSEGVITQRILILFRHICTVNKRLRESGAGSQKEPHHEMTLFLAQSIFDIG